MLDIVKNREGLLDAASQENTVKISQFGSLVVETGKCTGRSPDAKFIVSDEQTMAKADKKNNQFCSREEYQDFKKGMMQYIHTVECYKQDLYAGADENHQIHLTVRTSTAWQALFANNMFVTQRERSDSPAEAWSLYCFPEYSETPRVMINFNLKEVLITGTWYAGEIKKSIFTVLNFILPEKNILPMHCSVNTDLSGGNASVFFGLSGTGKTTLSADSDRLLVGDDEHGWSDEGLFNFEGGCYAKVINLSRDFEPEIWNAVNQEGSILENVRLDNLVPDFNDGSLTENTRGSYPLSHIPNVFDRGVCEHPENVIFLTCDAFGVLPPVSKLEGDDMVKQFLMGYTAKVAGTEAGITEPIATFSPCFGAPFMPRSPNVYADMLKEKVEQHSVNCWLVNTGWAGGGPNTGKRMPIQVSRSIVRRIISGELARCEFVSHKYTNLLIPTETRDETLNEFVHPENRWKDLNDYKRSVKKLMELWSEK